MEAARTDGLRLAVAQPADADGDIGRNLAAHAALVRRAGARVVVFPELSITGYRYDAEAIDPSDRRLGPLIDACWSTDTVALVGTPVANPERSIGNARAEARACPDLVSGVAMMCDRSGFLVATSPMRVFGTTGRCLRSRTSWPPKPKR